MALLYKGGDQLEDLFIKLYRNIFSLKLWVFLKVVSQYFHAESANRQES